MARRTEALMGGALRQGPAPRIAAGPTRLVCVSHREPYAAGRDPGALLERTTGGLVTAIDAALRELGGAWIASGDRPNRISAPCDDSGRTYEIRQIGLSNAEVDAYYAGFSNGVLWPLFHYFVDRVHYSGDDWRAYQQVNERFADALAGRLDECGHDCVAWVHDYQLALVPRLLRERRPRAKVGFFLHIPFPAYEVFRILPVRREVLRGMLGADLLGFHTQSYLDAFLDSVKRLLGARVDRSGTVEYEGHRTRTLASPIGADVARQIELAQDPRTAVRAARLRRSVGVEGLLLGVDRLDYSKGLLERLDGFELLLRQHPEHRRRVALVQIAVPSRTRVEEYRQLKRQLDEAVGRINGTYGDAGWTPVHYMTRSLQEAELAGYYQAADIAVVTSLRDGLNLVAKEFVLSRIHNSGALVLSEFAGAAEELAQAYFVNPFGPESICDALHRALTDERSERERRMSALRARARANDIHTWARTFVERLRQAT